MCACPSFSSCGARSWKQRHCLVPMPASPAGIDGPCNGRQWSYVDGYFLRCLSLVNASGATIPVIPPPFFPSWALGETLVSPYHMVSALVTFSEVHMANFYLSVSRSAPSWQASVKSPSNSAWFYLQLLFKDSRLTGMRQTVHLSELTCLRESAMPARWHYATCPAPIKVRRWRSYAITHTLERRLASDMGVVTAQYSFNPGVEVLPGQTLHQKKKKRSTKMDAPVVVLEAPTPLFIIRLSSAEIVG
ncbi:hypothetical protein BJY52DRAFT_1418788 [Lactarius psammicola]|nr:hypothetical protein BJY52DRAFT_1418788 [Lactarius psammicola]